MDDNRTPPQSISLPAPVEGHQQASMAPIPDKPVAQVPQPTSPAQQNAQAEDADLIEPIWVQRTEELIKHYANDPYSLSQKLYELRSEYIHKRYGKSLKQMTERQDG